MELLKTNEEIILEQLDLKHAPYIFRTIDKYRDIMREWLPFVDDTKRVEDSVEFVEYVKNTGDPNFAILYYGHFAGLAGLKDIDYNNRRGEIGYWVSPEYQNRGIATNCCHFLLDYGFNELNLNRIQVRIAIGNMKSLRIAEKLGFCFEGVERDGELLVSGFHDINVYSLLKWEWVEEE